MIENANEINHFPSEWIGKMCRLFKDFCPRQEESYYDLAQVCVTGFYKSHYANTGERFAERILVCLDTSDRLLCQETYIEQIIREVRRIAHKFGVKLLDIIQFCDGVYKEAEYKRKQCYNPTDFTATSQGADASFESLFKYIDSKYEEKRKKFNGIIIFTNDRVYNENFRPRKYTKNIIWTIYTDKEEASIPREYGRQIQITTSGNVV